MQVPLHNISPNLLYTAKSLPLNLEGILNGCSAFLCLSGPSLNDLPLQELSRRGVITAGVNNVAATKIRPNYWFGCDHPQNFCDNIWRDPGIIKFVPEESMEKSFLTRDARGKLQPSNLRVYQMPNVIKYRLNKAFDERSFLTESTISWGLHGSHRDSQGNKGNRSVFLPAIRILFYLGVRTLYLLGCDFNMQETQPYAFPQNKSKGACHSNNAGYEIINKRMHMLLPYFAEYKFKIYNCNSDSKLTAFPYVSFQEATAQIFSTIPDNVNTLGMYEN